MKLSRRQCIFLCLPIFVIGVLLIGYSPIISYEQIVKSHNSATNARNLMTENFTLLEQLRKILNEENLLPANNSYSQNSEITEKPDENSTELDSDLLLSSEQPKTVPEYQYNPEISMRSNAAYAVQRCEELPESVVAQIARKPFAYASRRARTLVSLRDRSFLYTPIPKVGFSTWTVIFHENVGLADVFGKNKRWTWFLSYRRLGLRIDNLATLADRNIKYENRVLFVRSPWDRLVSAYVNKAVHADGRYTKSHHMPCAWQKMSSPSILTFKEFISCIIKRTKRRKLPLWSRGASVSMDHHWVPQVHLSLPCNTNYTLISKYDHFQDDTLFMIKYRHLNATLLRRNKSERGEDDGLAGWYSQLDQTQIEDLQQIYKYDFEIFGFDIRAPSKSTTVS